MSSPKEKAKELFDRHLMSQFIMSRETAKVHSLITIDEILKSGCTLPSNNAYYGCNEEASKYWLEVKSELEKL
jgi:hypothetical protein